MYEQQRKKGRPLTGTERSLIEHLYKLGFTQTAIAKEVGVWPSTICRELRRGMVDQLNGDTWEYYVVTPSASIPSWSANSEPLSFVMVWNINFQSRPI